MPHGLRLVIGGRREAGDQPDLPRISPKISPHEAEARALVEAWLDAPSASGVHAIEDLVARVARALAERDARVVAALAAPDARLAPAALTLPS